MNIIDYNENIYKQSKRLRSMPQTIFAVIKRVSIPYKFFSSIEITGAKFQKASTKPCVLVMLDIQIELQD